ncbi:MAG: ABC transporter substrate-binding protein, partial [Anaerolineales bacterium]
QSPGDDVRLASLQQSAPDGVQEKLRAASDSVEGERKPVTILFADIVGSTSIAEKLDPEEWKEVVAGAHQRVGEAIYRYEGTIAQLLGDGVLAFFGAPITHEDDPIRAVRAALDIQESIREYARELEGYVDDFQMRVGINTGTVVIGDIGTDLHVEYLAIGDAVNVAARLESAAEPGSVLISDISARLIGDDFELVDRGEISAKGKSEGVPALEVVGTTGIPEVRRGIGRTQAPYVGREQELGSLLSKIQSLREGQGHIVAVLGEPGIGKSRLVDEARRSSDEDKRSEETDIRWLEGRSLSYGKTLSFWPIAQLLLSDLGLSDGAPEVKIKVELRKRVDALLGDKAVEAFAYLGHLMGLGSDPKIKEHIQGLDGETVKRQTMIALTEYFRRVAESQPTALVLEDLHWADPSSMEVLERLLPLTDRVALMILIPMRIERDHRSWLLLSEARTEYPHRYAEIHLGRLSDGQIDQLVQDLLRVSEAAEQIRELVRSRAEGNPLYLEEMVHHLLERGLIERVNGNWQPTEAIEDSGVPETLEGVLLARIDCLDADVRDTLQLASVIGKSFLYRILQAISEAEQELEGHLTQLQRVDLVREKARQPELEYIFKHALTQEAAYNSLLQGRRREFHAKVGEALEQLFPDRIEEFLGLLAHHFDAAEAQDKALSYLIQAGDKARLEEAHEEALDLYGRALQLSQESGDAAREAHTWLKISLIHLKEFNFEAAHEAHEAAFGLQQSLRLNQKAETIRKSKEVRESRVVRLVAVGERWVIRLDPAKQKSIGDGVAQKLISAGLTQTDAEMNVLPHVARSWEVLDGGIRYVFHLRDDVFWTDGQRVTAEDFRWSWLRTISQGSEANAVLFVDDIVGAREYREGRSTDPNGVGIGVPDPLTFEVRLKRPVPYFIYLVAHTALFPVPRHVVERHGDAWTSPERIVSNGPFVVNRLDEARVAWIRNPAYFGRFPGNIQRFEWFLAPDAESAIDAYTEGKADVAYSFPPEELTADLPLNEIYRPLKHYSTAMLALNPLLPPLDDVRVRRALTHAIDRSRVREFGPESRRLGDLGGIIPAGMPGHSPEIGLEHDRAKAEHLIGRAGFPKGKDLPELIASCYGADKLREVFSQWKEQFGLDPEIIDEEYGDQPPEPSKTHIGAWVWVADYPDPDSFLRTSVVYRFLHEVGWSGITHCDELLEAAQRSQDRIRRLEIYRQIDRFLVEEQVVVVPVYYGTRRWATLVKPWVHGWRTDALGYTRSQDISVEPH